MRRIAAECIYIDERGGVRHSARAGGRDRAANSESSTAAANATLLEAAAAAVRAQRLRRAGRGRYAHP